ncbi:hypothetical protein EZ428_05950 [Pedobacter frigiditerrae]|uniref:Uncharacterized protein n=1 Tax=Pedobacter frigiditerrae TaxID=2530452 RepID=A0A4R0N7Y2_9SPHI|nr:hypothetical protein [Pedobacter frigiditerrae]TCC94314.1 hypothetical protein EZ428_05950 [Pedobacter frigiditerrae]
MEFNYFFGPDKSPFAISAEGKIQQELSTPFHGIISRGLLDHGCSIWNTHSHLLEYGNDDLLTEEWIILKQNATQCGVLSFAQSTLAAKKYVETNTKVAKVELWNIKEGHTSSVWKVTPANEEPFVLNIARDQVAGEELKTLSTHLKKITDEGDTSHLAKVYDIVEIEDEQLPIKVVLTKNEWINDSFEIHSRINLKTNEEELLLVERFITDAQKPAEITSILGRVFNATETQQIKKEILNFLTQATTCLSHTPVININDGDVVWNGEKAVVIAIN